MKLVDFIEAQGRTYRRAMALQSRMDELARDTAAQGNEQEAEKLRAIGARVWLVADRYIDAMFARVQ